MGKRRMLLLIAIYAISSQFLPTHVLVPTNWLWAALVVGFFLGCLAKPGSYDE